MAAYVPAADALAELPAEVRLMNVTAAGLAVIAAVLLVAIALMWLSRQPLFAVRAIAVDGDVARNSVFNAIISTWF